MIGGIPKISIGFAKFLANVIKKSNPQGVEKLSNIQQQMFAYLHCFVSVESLVWLFSYYLEFSGFNSKYAFLSLYRQY